MVARERWKEVMQPVNLQLGGRNHHHVVYHKDHGEVFGQWMAPASMDQIIEDCLVWCRNTGINVFNLHLTGATRHFLGIEPYATHVEPPFVHQNYWRIYSTLQRQRDMGVSTLDEIARALHRHGIAFWAGLRVNDIHHTTGGESAHPQFWVDHPECRIGESVPWDPNRSPGALDFAHASVREHLKGIVQRLLDNHDVDGIDLDFNRFPILFKSAEVDQHRDSLTQCLREIRLLVDRAAENRKHPVHLEVRVPSVAEQCFRIGIDALRWIREEIVHILTASPSRFAEFEMPLEPFFDAARGRRVLVFAGIEGLQADGVLSREMYRAWAFHSWKTGADGLHLFNNCYDPIHVGRPHPVQELHDPDWLNRLDKRYVVTRTMPGRLTPDISDRTLSYPKLLPRRLEERQPLTLPITVHDDIASARLENTLESLTLRVRVMEFTSGDRIEIRVNGQPIASSDIRIRGSQWERRQANVPGAYAESPWRADASGCYSWFLCDLTNHPSMKTGTNEISVTLVEKNREVVAPLEVYNLEVDVKYRAAPAEGNCRLGRFETL